MIINDVVSDVTKKHIFTANSNIMPANIAHK